MEILIGTTNHSKVRRITEFLADTGARILTLADIEAAVGHKLGEPDEVGATPEENARVKAAYYRQYHEPVICQDSGLYFDELPFDDPRQPGLNIRTPNGRKRLNDDEMIEYYSSLVASLGGQVTAYYLDGYAVSRGGNITSFMENSETTRLGSFYMVSTPSEKRNPGWPLNSLSINKNTLEYFAEAGGDRYKSLGDEASIAAYKSRLVEFLHQALGLD